MSALRNRMCSQCRARRYRDGRGCRGRGRRGRGAVALPLRPDGGRVRRGQPEDGGPAVRVDPRRQGVVLEPAGELAVLGLVPEQQLVQPQGAEGVRLDGQQPAVDVVEGVHPAVVGQADGRQPGELVGRLGHGAVRRELLPGVVLLGDGGEVEVVPVLVEPVEEPRVQPVPVVDDEQVGLGGQGGEVVLLGAHVPEHRASTPGRGPAGGTARRPGRPGRTRSARAGRPGPGPARS